MRRRLLLAALALFGIAALLALLYIGQEMVAASLALLLSGGGVAAAHRAQSIAATGAAADRAEVAAAEVAAMPEQLSAGRDYAVRALAAMDDEAKPGLIDELLG